MHLNERSFESDSTLFLITEEQGRSTYHEHDITWWMKIFLLQKKVEIVFTWVDRNQQSDIVSMPEIIMVSPI